MRYRLRTLLVCVTLACGILGWAGWQFRIVANRRAIAAQLERDNQGVVIWEGIAFAENYERVIEGDKSRRVPWFRRLLGDENAADIAFYSAASSKRAAIEAFPEADVYLP